MTAADPLMVEFRALRNMLGLRAEDIARIAKVDKSSLSYWETGRHSPHLDKLRAVCAAAGFDIALAPADPESDAAEALYVRSGAAEAARARAEVERDRLVEVIARLVSLPPEAIAHAYGVGYTGTIRAALDKLTTSTEETPA